MRLKDFQKFVPLFILIVGLVLIIIVIVSVYLINRNSKLYGSTPDQNVIYQKSFNSIAQQESSTHAQEQKVAQLITKLPYQGKLFKLEYYIPTNQFTLTVNNDQRAQGLAEFKQYLSDNGIDESTQLSNLQVKYQ